MKTRIYAAAAVLMSCASCSMDEIVYSDMTAGEYYANFSESDVPAAIGKLYSDLRLLYCGNDVHKEGCWYYTNEEMADLWVTPKRGGSWYDGGIYYRLNQHRWEWTDAHVLNNWRKAYRCINDCNRLIYEFSNAGLASEVEMMSEIRVARAFWYWVLCDMYGNVPIQTKYDVPDNFLPETSSRQEVFEFMVSELQESIPHLLAKAYGRWDSFAAKCLLAKCYLNAASWGVTVEGNAWDKVAELCDEIISPGKYSLEADYKASFVTENQNSSEIIMAVCNDETYDDSEPFRIHLWTMHWKYCYHANTVTQYWGGCCATPEFAMSYDPDDLRYGKSWFEGQLYDNTGVYTGKPGSLLYCDPWDSRDKGKPLCHTKEVPLFEGDAIPTTGEASGVRMQKYEIRTGALNRLSNDFVLFRYADVLFMKAEALYWKNGGVATQDCCDLINSVRKRAFTTFTDDKKVTVAQLDDDRFLQEYAWEFCQEGQRRQQLIRFGQFLTKEWFLHEPTNDTDRLLFPIPREEMLANPNLKQNLGYPKL